MHHFYQFIPFQMPMLGALCLSNYVPFKAAEMFVIPSTAHRSPRPSCNKTLGKRSKNHARSEWERSCQGEEEVWSDPSLLLAEFEGRARWRVSCLTNALLANVSRPPTELHPSLVVVMCARCMSPALSALFWGGACDTPTANCKPAGVCSGFHDNVCHKCSP